MEIVRLLLDLPLERGVSANAALRHTIGHTEIVKMLLQAKK